jgi:hypothetical protein
LVEEVVVVTDAEGVIDWSRVVEAVQSPPFRPIGSLPLTKVKIPVTV